MSFCSIRHTATNLSASGGVGGMCGVPPAAAAAHGAAERPRPATM